MNIPDRFSYGFSATLSVNLLTDDTGVQRLPRGLLNQCRNGRGTEIHLLRNLGKCDSTDWAIFFLHTFSEEERLEKCSSTHDTSS